MRLRTRRNDGGSAIFHRSVGFLAVGTSIPPKVIESVFGLDEEFVILQDHRAGRTDESKTDVMLNDRNQVLGQGLSPVILNSREPR